MVCAPDENTDFFDVVTGVSQGDTIELYMLVIYLDYVLRMQIFIIKENTFTLKKTSRLYPAETATGEDYTNDFALLIQIPQQQYLTNWKGYWYTPKEDMTINSL